MSFFNTTLVNGVQDISALLPLLGTEQLETHVGSALVGGFMYAAVAPISIFGCLGAAKLGLSVAIASIVYRSSKVTLIGPKWLSDGGFELRGKVANFIGLEGSSGVYVAESQLMTMLKERHIENIDKLRVDWGNGYNVWVWNLCLIAFSILFAAISITPYVPVVYWQEDGPPGLPWLYPVIRALGTTTVSVLAQIVIQIRVVQIIRSRLIFMTIDKSCPEEVKMVMGGEWDAQKSSEESLWVLQSKINAPLDVEENLRPTLLQLDGVLSTARDRLRPHRAEPLLLLMSAVLILPGTLLSVAGYVGSFTLLQSTAAPGPLVWLTLEVTLSIIRMVVWAWNPGYDDNPGLFFTLSLSDNLPLVTCNKPDEDILSGAKLPVTRSDSFLREITKYTGPLELFNPENISIYYTLTARTNTDHTQPKLLYLTVLDYKEEASSVIMRRSAGNSWEYFKMESARWDILRIKLGDKIDASENPFTRDTTFLQEVEAHCSQIAAEFALRGEENALRWSNPYKLRTNWAFVLKPKEKSHSGKFPHPSDADKAYMDHGKREKKTKHFYHCRNLWNREHMRMVREELLKDLPKGENATIGDRLEINEIENLLITECFQMENILVAEFEDKENGLQEEHTKMLQLIQSGLSPFTVLTKTGQKDESDIVADRLREEWAMHTKVVLKSANDAISECYYKDCSQIAAEFARRELENTPHWNATYDMLASWALVLEPKQKNHFGEFPRPSDADKAYMDYGNRKKEAREFYHYRDLWNREQMRMVREELLKDLPQGENATIGDKLEINEIENLLITECLQMEKILADEFEDKENDLQERTHKDVQAYSEHVGSIQCSHENWAEG